jgi:hypothetical protein
MGAKMIERRAESVLLLVLLMVINIPAYADDFNVKSNGATADGKTDDGKVLLYDDLYYLCSLFEIKLHS